MLDITMTATLRPGILKQTLESFKKNLFVDYPCRLILNVDPIGEEGCTQHDVCKVAEQYFDQIRVRFPDRAHFGNAFHWCWSETTSPYVFHLEDDWVLNRPVPLEDLLRLMHDEPQLACLRLAHRPIEEEQKSWRYFLKYNGRYFTIPDNIKIEIGYAGHPTLIRGVFVKEVIKHLLPYYNPEKQFRYNYGVVLAQLPWQFGVWGQQHSPALLNDIGGKWRIKQGLRKVGIKAFFTNWEKGD